MHAAADVMFSLLTSGFVFFPSLSLTWIQFVLSVQFVLWVQLLLDRSWLATVHDVSSRTHHMINLSRPSPCFSYCKHQKLGVGLGTRLPTNNLKGCDTYEELVGSKAIPYKPFIYSGWTKIADTVQMWPHKSYGKSYQHPRFLTTAHAYT